MGAHGQCFNPAEFGLAPVDDPGPLLRGLSVQVCAACLPQAVRLAPGTLVVVSL